MHYVQVVALLAVLQYLLFGLLVGRARMRFHVNAPATTGNEEFERVYRVHVNTLEQLAAFLPVLWVASLYWPDRWVALIGAVYLVGRFAYRRLYLADPAKRGPGFLLTVGPTFVLLVMGLAGAMAR